MADGKVARKQSHVSENTLFVGLRTEQKLLIFGNRL